MNDYHESSIFYITTFIFKWKFDMETGLNYCEYKIRNMVGPNVHT